MEPCDELGISVSRECAQDTWLRLHKGTLDKRVPKRIEVHAGAKDKMIFLLSAAGGQLYL